MKPVPSLEEYNLETLLSKGYISQFKSEEVPKSNWDTVGTEIMDDLILHVEEMDNMVIDLNFGKSITVDQTEELEYITAYLHTLWKELIRIRQGIK